MIECKMCKSKAVVAAQASEEISYKGAMLSVPMAYSTCQNCHREFISSDQIQQNDKAIRDAKKHTMVCLRLPRWQKPESSWA